jgi:hypothetical protein
MVLRFEVGVILGYCMDVSESSELDAPRSHLEYDYRKPGHNAIQQTG